MAELYWKVSEVHRISAAPDSPSASLRDFRDRIRDTYGDQRRSVWVIELEGPDEAAAAAYAVKQVTTDPSISGPQRSHRRRSRRRSPLRRLLQPPTGWHSAVSSMPRRAPCTTRSTAARRRSGTGPSGPCGERGAVLPSSPRRGGRCGSPELIRGRQRGLRGWDRGRARGRWRGRRATAARSSALRCCGVALSGVLRLRGPQLPETPSAAARESA